MLRRLKQAGMRTAILSNGSPRMLDAIVAGARIGTCSTPCSRSRRSVSTSRTPRSISSRFDRLGVPAGAIAFQSSNAWDAHAASAFGMQVVWCKPLRPAARAPARRARSRDPQPGRAGRRWSG